MHTATELQASDFQYNLVNNSDSIDRSNVMPAISPSDRVGVVLQEPFDGIGAGNFVLSCITAFYDIYRKENEDFFSYPDYFTFQSSDQLVDYLWFDIWPNHKNVETKRNAETILRAINDRAVNILLVPDRASSAETPDIEDQTRESAQRRIDDCFAYAHDGILEDADFSIEMPAEPTWTWIERNLNTIADDESARRQRREEKWRDRAETGSITQEFRQISLEEAIRKLPHGHDAK